MSAAPRVRVLGAGLAGCEAAWQAAQRGIDVELFEMRPQRRGPAHVTDALAELVCSNSLRGAALENAVGLLKEELACLDSLIVGAAPTSSSGVVIFDCRVDKAENCLPMIPSGKAHNEMILPDFKGDVGEVIDAKGRELV